LVNSGAVSGGQVKYLEIEPTSIDLLGVIRVWPRLSPEVRAAITSMALLHA